MTFTPVRVAHHDRQDGSELCSNPDLTHCETYEVRARPRAYVNERDSALLLAGRTMVPTLDSAVLSGI